MVYPPSPVTRLYLVFLQFCQHNSFTDMAPALSTTVGDIQLCGKTDCHNKASHPLVFLPLLPPHLSIVCEQHHVSRALAAEVKVVGRVKP